MKIIKIHLRSIASFLAIVMLLQSCTIYKTSITLDQAVQNESKVKVKTKDAENLKFNRIGIENGNYYGIKKMEDKMVKTPLDEKVVISIKEKDEKLSTLGTVGLGVVLCLGIIVGAFFITGGNEIGR